MARGKSYRIQYHAGRLHTVTAAEWHRALSDGILIAVPHEQMNLARLAPGVYARVVAGVLVLWAMTPSIRSTWAAFERAWRERYSTHQASELGGTLFERQQRALAKRQAEIDLDALFWKHRIRGRNANQMTYMTAEQAHEIIQALCPEVAQ